MATMAFFNRLLGEPMSSDSTPQAADLDAERLQYRALSSGAVVALVQDCGVPGIIRAVLIGVIEITTHDS